jgi:exopolysaccharide biosynthesis polyprenyl glycosylphosphotransferase
VVDRATGIRQPEDVPTAIFRDSPGEEERSSRRDQNQPLVETFRIKVKEMSQAPVVFPELFSAEKSRTRFSWSYAGRHFDDLGPVRTGLYGFVRDLIPAILVIAWWFLQRPITLSNLPEVLQTPQLTLLDLILLAALALCWRLIAGSKMASGSNLFRKQLVGNLLAAPSCAVLVFAEGCTHTSPAHSLCLSIYFLLAASTSSVLLLSATCVVRWAMLAFVVAKREVILVGSGPRAQELFAQLMESPAHVVIGIVDDEFTGTPEMRSLYVGGIDELERILKDQPIQIVYCSLPVKTMYSKAQRAISICEKIGVEVRHSARLFTTEIAQVDAQGSAHGMYAILRMVRQGSRDYVKRAIDVIGASILIVLTAPVMAAAAIAIKLTSPGPIFFSQERYGMDRRRFRIHKLRTMVIDAEGLQKKYEAMNELAGPVFKIRCDPRITKVGRFLRSTSIDELPQLWNVFKGDMSLVGPRPLAVRDVRLIDDSRHLRRFSVKPGITCLWQIGGRNATDFETWIRQDLDYIDRWSLLLDFRILLYTVPAVFGRRGAM